MQLRCSTAQAVLSLWQVDDLRDDISCRCIQASTATMCRSQVILSLRPHSSPPLALQLQKFPSAATHVLVYSGLKALQPLQVLLVQ
jgi:hypothetical protein